MNLGESLFGARKNTGLTQEAVAEKLGVSRQTISKWETGETLPDIRQSKRLAVLYGMTLDETSAKIDWTKMWSRRYPILARYREEVDVPRYEAELRRLLDQLKKAYGYGDLDTFLVLKDILAGIWKEQS